VIDKPKLCYVLPKFDEATEEHFFHTYQLLQELARETDLTVIVERSVGRPRFGDATVFAQRWIRIAPLRLLEIVWFCLRARLRGCRCFYVHYSFFGAWAAWLVTRLFGGRVYYWHCVSVVFRKRGWRPEALAHRVKAEWPLRLTMKLVDHVVTGTESVADFYANTFRLRRERLRVVPNEIDPTRFGSNPERAERLRKDLGLDPDDRVVLYVHRVVERKGARYLPDIARGVLQRDPRARFVVAGDGPALPWLRAAVSADPDLQARMRLVGWVPNAAIAAYYGMADAFLMPSEEEGFPRVLLESMAAGIPFVASDVGGVRDICSSAQQWGLAAVGDVATFVSKLLRLLEDETLHRELREEGFVRVQQYGIRAVTRTTLDQLALRSAGPGTQVVPVP
jgi:glycosyltransferase involved in cell wall biosynthesis